MKKRILALLLAGLLALGLAACGGSAEPDPGQIPEEADETAGIPAADLKIGLILVGEADDAYNRNHLEGMRSACESLDLSFDAQVVVKTGVPENAACYNAVGQLLDAGCQVVFANAYGHESYLNRAASEHPDVQFCCAGGYEGASDNLDNTHDYYAQVYQARYLAGIAAGLRTETGKLGYVAAVPVAQVISGYAAFYLGAKSVNPDAVMLVSYTGQWSNAASESAAAQALIDQGCDVISQHSDTAAPAAVAEANGVCAVGYNEDMISAAPHAALTSARIDWGVYYAYALGCLLSGEAIGQDWCGDLSQGACTLTPWNEDAVAAGTEAAVAQAAGQLADGSLQVFAGPLHGTDVDGNELTLARGETYTENETASAPSFIYIPDGVIVLP